MNIADYNQMLPRNINALIEDKGLKKAAVAKWAGFSKQQFTDMLNGRKVIKPCDVLSIANVLGVQPGELFVRDGPDERDSA